MRLTVNGDERQRCQTDDMIYDIFEQIAYLTQVMTLMPGDILATGTPAGIGAPTGRFLKGATSCAPRSRDSARSRTAWCSRRR